MARQKASLRKTFLCAVRLWQGDYPGGWSRGNIATLATSVRSVARKQGYRGDEVIRMQRKLERDGLVEVTGRGSGQSIRLTPKGRKEATCKSVKLAPWTDADYEGSRLDGGCRYGRVTRGPRKGQCRVRPKR